MIITDDIIDQCIDCPLNASTWPAWDCPACQCKAFFDLWCREIEVGIMYK